MCVYIMYKVLIYMYVFLTTMSCRGVCAHVLPNWCHRVLHL